MGILIEYLEFRLYIKNRSDANAELLEINDEKTLKNHRKPTFSFRRLSILQVVEDKSEV